MSDFLEVPAKLLEEGKCRSRWRAIPWDTGVAAKKRSPAEVGLGKWLI